MFKNKRITVLIILLIVAVGVAAYVSNTKLQKGSFITLPVLTISKPDLVLNSLSFSTYTADSGTKHVVLSANVANTGANFSKNFSVKSARFYAGGVEVTGSGTTVTSTGGLGSGVKKIIKVTDYTACQLIGTEKISVRVDASAAVSESNENNNYLEVTKKAWEKYLIGVSC